LRERWREVIELLRLKCRGQRGPVTRRGRIKLARQALQMGTALRHQSEEAILGFRMIGVRHFVPSKSCDNDNTERHRMMLAKARVFPAGLAWGMPP